jgi:hypothetical protein
MSVDVIFAALDAVPRNSFNWCLAKAALDVFGNKSFSYQNCTKQSVGKFAYQTFNIFSVRIKHLYFLHSTYIILYGPQVSFCESPQKFMFSGSKDHPEVAGLQASFSNPRVFLNFHGSKDH